MSWRKGSKSRRAIEGGAPSLRSAPRLQGFSFISLLALATLENIKLIAFRQRKARKGCRAGDREGRKWPSWQLLSIPMPLKIIIKNALCSRPRRQLPPSASRMQTRASQERAPASGGWEQRGCSASLSTDGCEPHEAMLCVLRTDVRRSRNGRRSLIQKNGRPRRGSGTSG